MRRIRGAHWVRKPAQLLLAVWLAAATAAAAAEAPPAPSASPEQRYDEARQIMQQGRYAEAATAFRSVTESTDAPTALRAQALFVSGLMLENARDYEAAADIYAEVLTRFPGTEAALKAADAATALKQGEGAQWMEFRRRRDAANDEVALGRGLVERGNDRAAEQAMQRAAVQLAALLADFPDHPRSGDVATALGDTLMFLARYREACAAYATALSIAKTRSDAAGNSFVAAAEGQLLEATRCFRRQLAACCAGVMLALIVVTLTALVTRAGMNTRVLTLAPSLGGVTLVLAAIGAAASYGLRNYSGDFTPISVPAAGLLVALPGLTGQAVALGFFGALQRRPGFSGRAALLAAVALGALAALCVATCVVYRFELFPLLDSEF